MSNYGPALFISRNDQKEMDKKEKAQLLQVVASSCRKNNIVDDLGNPVFPTAYDNGGSEKNAVSFLLYSSGTFSMMPEEARKDQRDADAEEIKKVESDIEKTFPELYNCRSYYVEN